MDDDVPFSMGRGKSSRPLSSHHDASSSASLRASSSAVSPPARSDASRKKKKPTKKKHVKPVPNIAPSIPPPYDDGEESPDTSGVLTASSSVDQLGVFDEFLDSDDTVEIPTDSMTPFLTPQPRRLRKRRVKRPESAARTMLEADDHDDGDDESGHAGSGSQSPDTEESDDSEETAPLAGKVKPTATGSSHELNVPAAATSVPTSSPPPTAAAATATSSNSHPSVAAARAASISSFGTPTEGNSTEGEAKPRTRMPRFRLQRAHGQSLGSHILWSGGVGGGGGGGSGVSGGPAAHSSFDEESDGVELTPLELARLHATMRRTRNGKSVPSIYDRPKNVIEAALGGPLPAPTHVPGTTVDPLQPQMDQEGIEMTEFHSSDFRGRHHGEDHDDLDDLEAGAGVLIPKYPLEELIPFLTLLAKTFHSYGAPVNRTEWNMREISESFGVMANFAVMPTQITITFGLPEGMDAISRTFRCDQDLVECGKLYMVEQLLIKIRQHKLDLYQARDELNQIISKAPNFPAPVRLLSLSVASASAAVLFFGGSWIEFGFALVLGFIVSTFNWAASRSLAFARVGEILAAVLVAAFAVPVTAYIKGTCFSALVLGSLVWLLPGLTLTLAVRELATKNMVAGTVRMFNAFMTSLKLGFGIAFGSYIPFWITRSKISAACTNPLSQWWFFLMFPLVVIPFNILLDTTIWQWPGQIVTSAVGYLISWTLSKYAKLPSELVTVLASFGVGLVGNAYALWSKSPGVVYIMSGILLMVPGSVGVRGAASFFDQDAWSGLQFSFTMIIIGFSITVGTLVADLIIFPRTKLLHFAF